VVKVVLDRAGFALYFSARRFRGRARRSPCPGGCAARPPAEGLPIYRHYGLYAYRAAFLRRFPTLTPAPIERFEALEQLRALWHGERIVVEVTAGTRRPASIRRRTSSACARSIAQVPLDAHLTVRRASGENRGATAATA